MEAQGARRALPGDVVHLLRTTFAAEVASRLPHLRSGDDPELARQDAHTLASSAWVVGERRISELARAVEEQLEQSGSAPDLQQLLAALESYVA